MELVGHYSNTDDLLRRLERIRQTPHKPRSAANRTPKRPQNRLTADETATLLQGYEQGETLDNLAERFGIHRTTVLNHVQRAGMERRIGIIDRHLDKAQTLYASGLSLAAVGTQFGVGKDAVRQAFHRHGIPVRPRPGWASRR